MTYRILWDVGEMLATIAENATEDVASAKPAASMAAVKRGAPPQPGAEVRTVPCCLSPGTAAARAAPIRRRSGRPTYPQEIFW
jgi:hypothetical protein